MSTVTAHPDDAGEQTGVVCRISILAPRELRGSRVLPNKTLTLGRTSANGVFEIAHATISRQHASLQQISAGTYSVTDLGSRNGTWINGAPVGTLPAVLRDGGVLRLGEVVSVFESGPALPAAPDGQDADRIPGRSLAAARLRATVVRAALSGGTALIEGESGTGKEFVASELHRLGGSAGPYVVANGAALSASLVDSQLFGHERGAFTGAVSPQQGYFRAANGGTLFLDEVGELPLELQPKLLRAVELGEVVPLGGVKVHRVQTRVVAATNRSLREEVEAGRFRRDLFARVAMQTIRVPPLRTRRADFMTWYELLHGRWSRAQSSIDVQPADFTAEALESLLLQPWPENLRGLDQLVHGVGGLLLTRGHSKINAADVRPWAREAVATDESDAAIEEPARPDRSKPPKPTREEFIAVMQREGWSVRGTARALQRDRRQIYRWVKSFGVIRPSDAPDD